MQTSERAAFWIIHGVMTSWMWRMQTAALKLFYIFTITDAHFTPLIVFLPNLIFFCPHSGKVSLSRTHPLFHTFILTFVCHSSFPTWFLTQRFCIISNNSISRLSWVRSVWEQLEGRKERKRIFFFCTTETAVGFLEVFVCSPELCC